MLRFISVSLLLSSYLLAFDFGSALKSASGFMEDKTAKEKEYTVPGYNKQTALMAADLAEGVFWNDFGKSSFLKRGFSHDGNITVSEGLVDLQFAYGSKGDINRKLDIVVSIRGSKETIDWITDINYIPTVYNKDIDPKITVHSGFLQSANLLVSKEDKANIKGKTLKELIRLNGEGKRNDRFIITGHSLGGAVATLYSTMLLDRGIKKENLLVYTFGAPPVSMDEGETKEQMSSTTMEGKLGALSNIALSSVTGSEKGENYYIDRYSDKIEIFRVYDKNDMVPKLLPPARHLGIPVMYGESLSKKDLLNKDKLWRIHWMDNYKKQINNTNPQDPSTKSGGLTDLIN